MRPFLPKAGWMLAGILALYVVSAFAGVVSGGDLDPPGLPGSTMKSLADVPPSWHRTLPADDGDLDGCNSSRFTCVMGGAGLLDNETGLVWDRNPLALGGSNDWTGAFYICSGSFAGGRQGWRLPTGVEMMTLRDDSLDHTPDGAPFPASDVYFWTASLEFQDPTSAFAFNLDSTDLLGVSKTGSTDYFVWCVRGPQPASHTAGPP